MRIHIFEGNRNTLLENFALADDSRQQVALYISRGDVLIASEDEDHTIYGHLQLTATDIEDVAEVKNMAVLPARQREGIGRALVDAAIARCRARRMSRLIVSTATADIGNLRFYQRLGFRMYQIVRDAFTAEKGYPGAIVVDGIPLRDQVFLDYRIAP